MRTKCLMIAIAVLVCAAAYTWIAVSVPGDSRAVPSAFAQQQQQVTSRAAVVGGRTAGEVLVGNQVVFRIRSSAGGLSPSQRADIVAQRLRVLLSEPVRTQDITTRRIGGQQVVMIGDMQVITADVTEARLNGLSTTQLGQRWASNLRSSVFGIPATGGGTTAVPVAQKVVPIISLGSGLRVGGALVTGPSARLDEVRAVAQVETDYQNAVRIRILVPVATENVVSDIRRVPQTSVAGLVDIGL